MGLERLAHDAQMLGRRAAAPADDPGTRIEGQTRIIAPSARRAVEVDVAVDELRYAAISLRNEYGSRMRRGGKVDDACHEFRGSGSTIAAAARQMMQPPQPGKLRRRNSHHRAAVGVEAQGGDDGKPRRPRAGDRRFGFLQRGHGFDPQDIGAAPRERGRLFRKRRTRSLRYQGSQGLRISPVGPMLPPTNTMRPQLRGLVVAQWPRRRLI